MYKVKVINLKRRQDRRNKIAHMFQEIDFEFVEALDGQSYELTDYDKKLIEGNEYEKYGIHIPSLICANYTHLNLIDECSKQDLPYFIFEDDVFLTDEKAPDLLFEKLALVDDLDIFFFIPDTPTIAAYIVYPQGAKKIIKDFERNNSLKQGLDWKLWNMRKDGKLRDDQAKVAYFGHNPGEDSDITTLENYDISSDK
tara:strand:- start:340 stop:933 length:594 start_codon:yes stop_codon:yes gene_type:complete